MGGSPSWKMTGLQLQSENSWFLPWWLVVRRQCYNDKYRGLVTVDFTLLDFSAANPVATAIWELEIFKVAGLVGRRQGYNCDLGTRDFWGRAQLEGDRAATAIWELVVFWWQTNCYLGTRVLGGRPSWEMTGLELQSGYSRFSLVAGLAQFDCNVRPGF